MAPKKNKSNATKGSANSGASPAPANVETAADKQLWAALRQEDEQALQELLFDVVQDAETGGVRFVAKPSAKSLVNRLNAKKRLPLSYAVEERLPDDFIVHLLAAGADVNAREEAKGANAALHHACYAEDEALVALLLRRGANPTVQNGNGETALHILAVTHNTRLLTTLLDSVAGTLTTTTTTMEADVDRGAHGRPVRMAPLELLAATSSVDGGTALHVALENSLEATEVLLTCMESTSASASASLVQSVLTCATVPAKDTPLHLVASLTHVTADVPAVVRVWERLLQLGAGAATALNGEQQTPLAALLDKGELTAARVADMQKVLHALDTHAEGERTIGSVLTQTDSQGLATVHVAIVRHQTAALNAMRAVLFEHASSMNVSETAQRWLGCPTRDGVRVVELLVSQDAPAEMLSVFEQLELIDKDEYTVLREAHQTEQRARAAALAEAEAQVEAEEAQEAEDDAARAEEVPSGAHRHAGAEKSSGGGGGGVSRVQQARKARATAATGNAASGRPHHKHGGKAAEATGAQASLGASGRPSTPMMVICGLLVLAAALMVYTSLVPPTVRGGDL